MNHMVAACSGCWFFFFPSFSFFCHGGETVAINTIHECTVVVTRHVDCFVVSSFLFRFHPATAPTPCDFSPPHMI
ncbi:hypothetical protein B0O80DRAFT_183311 [Mortierella sp. GBAus27b]|nr:hypothetical protein B0O80DRAFT_183311 [Mortierella sp. GBAus27b]